MSLPRFIDRRNRIIRQLKFLKTSLQAAQPPYFEIATLHHVLPRHAGRVWLASTNRALLTLGEPSPACERASVQTRSHLGADAVASHPRRGCVCPRVRRQSLSKLFSTPPNLPTFKRSGYKTEGRYNKKGTCHFVAMTRPQLFIQLFNQNSYYISYISCKPYPSSEVFSSSDSEVDTSGRCPLLDSDRCYI